MRSALQLLGGIAVAGAVAAGTTAFTASGVTNTIAAGDKTTAGAILLGGSVTQSVVGALLTSVTAVNNGTPNQYNSINLALTDTAGTALPANKVVTIDVASTGSSAAASAIACTTANQLAYTCAATSTNFWTAITSVVVHVA